MRWCEVRWWCGVRWCGVRWCEKVERWEWMMGVGEVGCGWGE